ncbi:GNAT family N-acetyltransferase [bacterium]|nr:GNAT family N-acetyltransferase [bacterium]
MPQLIGDRIRLRAPEREDLSRFLKWVNDPDVTENLMLVYPLSFTEEEGWYENMLKTPPASHPMVIEIRDENTESGYLPIGDCQFHNIDWRCRAAEIGIMIGEKTYWNQGYGTETMKLLLKHGFESLNLHRIWLRVYSKNKRGIRAYEKAGFTNEGMLRQAHYQHGQYYDVHLMSVLRNEWDDLVSEEN